MRNFPNDMEQRPVSRLEKGVLMRQAAVIALCVILLSGCCIPVPRSQNVARVPGILRQRPKLDGVVEGITTRHELEQILSGFSTNAEDRSRNAVLFNDRLGDYPTRVQSDPHRPLSPRVS